MLFTSRARGAQVELLASRFIQRQGLKLITRNFRQKTGEIDIIALEKTAHSNLPTLAFIEVRFRAKPNYGAGFETVDYFKQQKIIRTAQLFLVKQQKYQQHPCRFDIISAQTYNGQLQFEWLKAAFEDQDNE